MCVYMCAYICMHTHHLTEVVAKVNRQADECQLFITDFAYHFGNRCEELCMAQRLWACYLMGFEGWRLNSLYPRPFLMFASFHFPA